MARPRKPDYIRITVTQMHGKRVVKPPQSVTFDATRDDDFSKALSAAQSVAAQFSATAEKTAEAEPEGGEA